jgi:hypothetical protein
MKEHKNIDRLFQEKFRDFEVNPPERIWQSIEHNMHHRPVRMQRSMWMWFSGIAVGLSLLFVMNNPFQLIPSTSQPSLTTPKSSTDTENIATTEQTNTQSTVTTNKITPLETNTPKSSNELVITTSTSKTIIKPSIIEQPSDKTDRLFTKANDNDKKALGYADEKTSQNEGLKPSRWSVSTIAAPVYMNTFNGNSALSSEMSDYHNQSLVSTSFGVQVAYRITKRLSIQSGVHMVDFAYLSKDVLLPNAGLTSDDVVALYDSYSETERAKMLGDYRQVFGYVEIPVEAKYRVAGKNDFGLNLVGGFSTLLLNKNEVTLETASSVDNIGKVDNLNSLNFSGNVGLELEYNIYKNVNFNLVPMFKVHSNTLNDNTNTFKPYSVGLYSGVNLRF